MTQEDFAKNLAQFIADEESSVFPYIPGAGYVLDQDALTNVIRDFLDQQESKGEK